MPPTLVVELGIDATNDDIIDQMRFMKRARSEQFYKYVVCVVRGFNDDSRELYEIPEVRAFCRRLVNLGFISYLEFSTFLNPEVPEDIRSMWAAAEVWLCGEGRLGNQIQLTREVLTEIQAALNQSNAKADAAAGGM